MNVLQCERCWHVCSWHFNYKFILHYGNDGRDSKQNRGLTSNIAFRLGGAFLSHRRLGCYFFGEINNTWCQKNNKFGFWFNGFSIRCPVPKLQTKNSSIERWKFSATLEPAWLLYQQRISCSHKFRANTNFRIRSSRATTFIEIRLQLEI